ncbi:MAG: hypothetical protein M1828_000431 [Chrysothrix sp. TS-e1954]|nr:MAG: hypothetical protein M1828_000431 [Chrysothrix sp. TS-e1954]
MGLRKQFIPNDDLAIPASSTDDHFLLVSKNLVWPAAAAASLAYLNAKYAFTYDIHLLSSAFRGAAYTKACEKNDRVNAFYMLEERALDPQIAKRIAIIFNGREWTYREFYDEALRHGQWLKRAHRVGAGDVVAMDFPNSSTFLFLWFGLWSIGAKPAFINYNLTGAPLVHCVKTATAKLLLVDDELTPAFTQDVTTQLSKIPVPVVFFTKDVADQIQRTPNIREPDTSRPSQSGADMAILIFTSGTTGLPKAAIFPWRRVYAISTFVTPWIGIKPTDRFFTPMPLYHSSADGGFVATIFAGATFVLGSRFSPSTFWSTVRDSKVTMIQYVGEMCRYLLAAPPSPNDKNHSVRLAIGNGMRADVWDRFKARFRIETIAEFYAATEAPGGTFNISSNDFSRGAIGRNGLLAGLVTGRRMKLVRIDTDTDMPYRDAKTGFCQVVAPDTPGELIVTLDKKDVKAEYLGYYGNDDASNKKLMFDVFKQGDAWYRSGDLLRKDTEGRWFFQDRLGDTFRWKAENVSTTEVSEVLGMHPQVDEANVYGVQLPGHDGRAGCAAIYLQGIATSPSPEVLKSLAEHATANLPRYAVPVFLRFSQDQRSTGTLKQQKVSLRNEGADPAKVAATGDSIYWLRGNTYTPFRSEDWQRLQGGQVKL